MSTWGLLFLIGGTVIVLAGLGMLRPSGGPKGLDVSRLLADAMKNNRGYPASGVSVTDAYGQHFEMTTPLQPMQAERYGGMTAEDMADELRRYGGNGPGPNHPG